MITPGTTKDSPQFVSTKAPAFKKLSILSTNYFGKLSFTKFQDQIKAVSAPEMLAPTIFPTDV